MWECGDAGAGTWWLRGGSGGLGASSERQCSAGRLPPRLWTEILTDKPLEPPTAYREGVTLRWLWGDRKRLLYILAGRPAGYPGTYPSIAQGMREVRSEERRVGKECRSRWSPYH